MDRLELIRQRAAAVAAVRAKPAPVTTTPLRHKGGKAAPRPLPVPPGDPAELRAKAAAQSSDRFGQIEAARLIREAMIIEAHRAGTPMMSTPRPEPEKRQRKPRVSTPRPDALTAEEKTRALALIAEGLCVKHVAVQLGRSEWTIKRMCEVAGVVPVKGTGRNQHARVGRVYEGMKEEAIRLLQSGECAYLQHVATRLNVSRHAVRRWARSAGIKTAAFLFDGERAREAQRKKTEAHNRAKAEKARAA